MWDSEIIQISAGLQEIIKNLYRIEAGDYIKVVDKVAGNNITFQVFETLEIVERPKIQCTEFRFRVCEINFEPHNGHVFIVSKYYYWPVTRSER